jgi:NADPH2:quinone reductase
MHVIEIQQAGGPEGLVLVEAPTPEPGPGQVRCRVEAAGVNFIDTYQRSGAYKVAFPFRPGSEGAGVIEALGPGVEGFAVGQRVAWASAPGSYATEVLVAADKAVPVPGGVSAEQAAALMLQGMTAHYLVNDTYRLGAGDWAVLHAAAGGVGLLLGQLARDKGAHLIGTVSTAAKAELARQAGVEHVVIHGEAAFEQEARRLTGGEGVHVVYDSIGQSTFRQSLAALRPRGLLALFGQSSGAVPPFDPQLLAAHGSLYLTRPTLVHYTQTPGELRRRSGELFAAVAAGSLRVAIGRRLPLAEAREAHRALAARETTGKVLLLP